MADVERLDPCQEAFAREYTQGDGRGDDVQGIDLPKIAGHRGILRHLCPSAFQPGSGDRRSKSVEAVLSGRHKGSNLQPIDGRIRIRSGFAWITNADSNPSHQIPTLQFKKRQPFGQITTDSCITLASHFAPDVRSRAIALDFWQEWMVQY